MSGNVNVHLGKELIDRLNRLVDATGRNRSTYTRDALSEYLDKNEKRLLANFSLSNKKKAKA